MGQIYSDGVGQYYTGANKLVHPVSKKQVADCFFDAWKLSLWYLELSVLALCGYDDAYTSRLTAKYVTESEKVPWGRKA
ncbi:hypothetical protein AD428_18035 [Achromobacter sp. DMS1]|nr:hypothetical protein AD428_18035 [Achromobacter sp. DMS1]